MGELVFAPGNLVYMYLIKQVVINEGYYTGYQLFNWNPYAAWGQIGIQLLLLTIFLVNGWLTCPKYKTTGVKPQLF